MAHKTRTHRRIPHNRKALFGHIGFRIPCCTLEIQQFEDLHGCELRVGVLLDCAGFVRALDAAGRNSTQLEGVLGPDFSSVCRGVLRSVADFSGLLGTHNPSVPGSNPGGPTICLQ